MHCGVLVQIHDDGNRYVLDARPTRITVWHILPDGDRRVIDEVVLEE